MRSLADKEPARNPAPRVSFWRAVLVVLGLAWLLATLWLLGYYWDHSGLRGEDAGAAMGGRWLVRADAQTLGLGLERRQAPNGTDPAIGDLMALRNAQRGGTMAEQAQALERLRQDAQGSDDESYRMSLAPVLACGASACDNAVFVQAAGELAAREPRWRSHALIIEAAYWSQAHASGNEGAAAQAVARLDRLVREESAPELRARWDALQACGRGCPVFEELVLDFVQQAAMN